MTRLVLVAMYASVWWHIEGSRPLVGGYLRGFGLDTALWIASIVAPVPARYALWALAMCVSLATPWLMRRAQVRSPLNVSHLPERFGLFTILVLGESFAAVVAGLHAQHDARAAVAAAGLLVATGLWWIYFDNFEGSVVRRAPTRVHDWRPTTWIYAHFPLAMCITLAGGGMHELIGHAGEGRRRRALFRLGGAGSVAAVVLGGGALRPEWHLGALAVAVALQVLLDTADDLWQQRGSAEARTEPAVGGR